MKPIPDKELYEFYLDTIGRCTSEIRDASDEVLEYNLFEEFDVGAHSFLHDETLDRLHEAGFLDSEMVAMSKQVRERWLALQSRTWTNDEIRTKNEWQELFKLCDRLKAKAKPL